MGASLRGSFVEIEQSTEPRLRGHSIRAGHWRAVNQRVSPTLMVPFMVDDTIQPDAATIGASSCRNHRVYSGHMGDRSFRRHR
jgi:hypothetical protein